MTDGKGQETQARNAIGRSAAAPGSAAPAEVNMDLYWPYLAPLIVVVLSSMTGSGPMIRTALALLGNYCVNTGFVMVTEIYDPWWFYLGIDALTAWIVLYRPAGRAQSLIGWTFIGQVMIHCVYGASKLLNENFDNYAASVRYWQILLAVALVQLVILGGWIGGHWWRRFTYRRGAADVARTSSA